MKLAYVYRYRDEKWMPALVADRSGSFYKVVDPNMVDPDVTNVGYGLWHHKTVVKLDMGWRE